ncbi:triacylglycerol lipase 1 [Selaginella moellendorffii]|uniref:triacylglycerol lipase 1 n=1 Tax=Selaginella moellendorffii TaxID=88036 RepID=UPI000D1C5635|nr:triacylglycerol lipase 1 [Selaginella moellendorffii]|eukprot:XP_024539846.1 triacylglycerol lipase 1 [Selaginella moellendorffii]
MSSPIIVLSVLLCCWKIQFSRALPTFRGGLNRADGLCVKLVQPYGYQCEELAVETKDGFLLGVQRVWSANYIGERKKPVFLNHGILIGGDIWVLNAPPESLAFILADAGHDVWIANVRTSEFSYGHVSYSRSDREFWDWSVDELSAYDLQAMLEMVYARTNSKVLYVGYSQGTQAAFAAFSEHRLVDIVEKAVMLAPVAYVDHATSLLTLGAQTHLDLLIASLGIYEFSLRAQNKPVTEYLCKLSDDPECTENFVTLLAGPNCCINDTRRAYYEIYEPQSTSAKNFGHLAQQFRGKSFDKFDYGFWQNLVRYGWISPPTYSLPNIPRTIPFLFFYAAKDALAAPQNVAQLVSELQSKPELVFLPDYAHLDFVVSYNAKDLVYPKVVEFFNS